MIRWRRRLIASVALVAAIAVVIVVLLSSHSPSPAGAASSQNQGSGVATVERRNLVETDTESGTLSYASPQTVYDRLSGTITWLPAVGQVIKPGQALYKVDGQPVILMDGTTPAYRALNASDSDGPDILELNRNLVALGFDAGAIVEDDVWQAATTDGVELLQESLGETATGSLSLGQIAFLPGPQLVSTVDATLGSDGSSGGTGSGTPTADPRRASPATEYVGLTRVVSTPAGPPKHKTGKPGHQPPKGSSSKSQTLSALIALLKAEVAELKAHEQPNGASSPSGGSGANSSRGGGSNGGSGANSGGGSSGSGSSGGGAGATAILQTSSTDLVATVDLDATKQSEATMGEKVTVEMPNGSTVNGTVTAVSPIAQSSSGSGNGSGNGSGGGNGDNGSGNSSSGATIPVTIALHGHQTGAGLDQAAVSVNFAQAQANNVLSVPVTALLATQGGGYAVQAAGSSHALIPVTTGLFAAGYVQISGAGIYDGLQVTDSQG